MKYFTLIAFLLLSSKVHSEHDEIILKQARTIALSWLDKATDDLHFYNLIQENIYLKHYRKVSQVREKLSQTKLKIINSRGCKNREYLAKNPAQFYWSRPKTHVCVQAMSLELDRLAQILIHESVHLTKIANECRTTQLEAFIIAWAGFENVPVISKYYKDCGFVDNPDAILNFSWLR